MDATESNCKSIKEIPRSLKVASAKGGHIFSPDHRNSSHPESPHPLIQDNLSSLRLQRQHGHIFLLSRAQHHLKPPIPSSRLFMVGILGVRARHCRPIYPVKIFMKLDECGCQMKGVNEKSLDESNLDSGANIRGPF